MNALVAEWRLWASGPFIEEGALVGDGLTILSTARSKRRPGLGRRAAYQARATHCRGEKMGAARGPDRYLVARVGQPVFALRSAMHCGSKEIATKADVSRNKKSKLTAFVWSVRRRLP